MRAAWAPCALAMLTLPGCAQKWEKPGASEGEFRTAEIRCEAAGLERHAPRLKWLRLSEGHVQRGYRSCRKGRCEYTPDRHVPPRNGNVDLNEHLRGRVVSLCLLEDRWRPVDCPPAPGM
jgi:hypothetical protein